MPTPSVMVISALIGRANVKAGQKALWPPDSVMSPQARAVPTAARASSDGMVISHCSQELACAMLRRIPGSRAPQRPAMIAECTSECRSMVGTVVVCPKIVKSAVSMTPAITPTKATRNQYARVKRRWAGAALGMLAIVSGPVTRPERASHRTGGQQSQADAHRRPVAGNAEHADQRHTESNDGHDRPGQQQAVARAASVHVEASSLPGHGWCPACPRVCRDDRTPAPVVRAESDRRSKQGD